MSPSLVQERSPVVLQTKTPSLNDNATLPAVPSAENATQTLQDQIVDTRLSMLERTRALISLRSHCKDQLDLTPFKDSIVGICGTEAADSALLKKALAYSVDCSFSEADKSMLQASQALRQLGAQAPKNYDHSIIRALGLLGGEEAATKLSSIAAAQKTHLQSLIDRNSTVEALGSQLSLNQRIELSMARLLQQSILKEQIAQGDRPAIDQLSAIRAGSPLQFYNIVADKHGSKPFLATKFTPKLTDFLYESLATPSPPSFELPKSPTVDPLRAVRQGLSTASQFNPTFNKDVTKAMQQLGDLYQKVGAKNEDTELLTKGKKIGDYAKTLHEADRLGIKFPFRFQADTLQMLVHHRKQTDHHAPLYVMVGARRDDIGVLSTLDHNARQLLDLGAQVIYFEPQTDKQEAEKRASIPQTYGRPISGSVVGLHGAPEFMAYTEQDPQAVRDLVASSRVFDADDAPHFRKLSAGTYAKGAIEVLISCSTGKATTNGGPNIVDTRAGIWPGIKVVGPVQDINSCHLRIMGGEVVGALFFDDYGHAQDNTKQPEIKAYEAQSKN